MKIAKIIKDNNIIILSILVIIFGYLLILCKNKYKEAFTVPAEGTNNTIPQANGFRIINITSNSIEVEFYAPEATGTGLNAPLVDNNSYSDNDIDGYTIVLAKYSDKTANSGPVGENYKTIFISNGQNNGNDTSMDIPKYNSKYFTRTIKIGYDDNNNDNDSTDYYYRVGIIVSYSDGNVSPITNVNNMRIKNNNNFFKLGDKDVEQIDIDFEEYLKFKEQQPKEIVINDDNCANGADGQLDFIKRNLGGYPDNLFVEERTGPKSLAELTKRQLSLGILDINVHTKKI